MLVLKSGLARIPDQLSSIEAAPLMCAGVTMFGALRSVPNAHAGDICVIHGVGGLGHLGIQFSKKMGFKTVVVSHDTDKKEAAYELGADLYIDSNSENAVEILNKLGGAKLIMATVPNGTVQSKLIDALSPNGTLVVIGTSMEPLVIQPGQLIQRRRFVHGWNVGTAQDIEDTLVFSVWANVRPLIQTFPFSKAQDAFALMEKGESRLRAVLVMDEENAHKAPMSMSSLRESLPSSSQEKALPPYEKIQAGQQPLKTK